MSEHLTSEQISNWAIGLRNDAMEQHASECRACMAEIERLQESLGMFRAAVRAKAGELAGSQKVLRVPKRRMAVIWLTAVAAVVTLTVLPVYKVQEHRQRAAETARQDAELMEQVNSELSQDVAEPMKPLEKMVSWGPAATVRKSGNY
jgi:hypothetical protein